MKNSLRQVCALGLTALLICAFAAPGNAVLLPNGKLQIIHLDVGQGDGTVIMSPLGEVIMVDDGVFNNTALVVRQVHDTLGVTHVRYHFASHLHADHIGSISQLQASGITFDAGWDRGGSFQSATYTTYNTTLGAKRHTLTKGQVFKLDSLSSHPVTITCIDLNGAGVPLDTTDRPENSRSAVLKLTYGEFDEVLGGDLTGFVNSSAGEKDIETTVSTEIGQVEAYKVHHHGSRYGSNDTWLNALNAKVGFIQVGDGNTYGHPTAEALGRLHNHGIRTFWNNTGAGVTPDPARDKVAHSRMTIQATWEPGGIDSIYFNSGFADTFSNSGGVTPPDTIRPVVNVTSPNGGETWLAGSSHLVTWTATDNKAVFSIDLDYSTDNGGSWNPIAAGISNGGVFNWNVPNTPTTQALVRVSAHDLAGNIGTDVSNATFTIPDQVAPVVTVTAPTGGETYAGGSSHNITWTATDNVAVTSVDLDYSLNGGAAWTSIAAATANTGTYGWAVPNTPSTQARVRVRARDGAGNLASDSSHANFAIADQSSPTAHVIAPNGGEIYTYGDPATVSWGSSDDLGVDSVTVEYSLNGAGGPWTQLGHGLPAADSLVWNVPSQTTDSALVRVTAYDHALNTGVDASDSMFHIGQAVLNVPPAGGWTLHLGHAVPNPSRGGVRLEYSIPSSGNVSFEILDVTGRRVWARDAGRMSAGQHRVEWDGRTASGDATPAGLYFVRMISSQGGRTAKLMRLP